MKTSGKCPLCGEEYDEVRIKTMHHILPKFWYNGKRSNSRNLFHLS